MTPEVLISNINSTYIQGLELRGWIVYSLDGLVLLGVRMQTIVRKHEWMGALMLLVCSVYLADVWCDEVISRLNS